jgi:hypothetical protein
MGRDCCFPRKICNSESHEGARVTFPALTVDHGSTINSPVIDV